MATPPWPSILHTSSPGIVLSVSDDRDPAARTEVHQLRAQVDAIVTGSITVQLDNPRLSVRPPVVAKTGPLRVIIDGVLRTSPTAQLFDEVGPGEVAGDVIILTLAGADASRWRALEAAGAEVHGLHTEDGDHISLREVQTWLWERGVHRMLIETGPSLLSAYLERGYVDQVRIYSGDVNGGRGTSMGLWLSSAKIEQRLDREIGVDAVLEGFLLE
jgi:diaminohydroxyphosphoribosylaminopyrimidine deaminase/5-amino-6-(5-phosphoribosylamino)uracil reductase